MVQRTRIPATLTAKSKPDLELYALELLKKLRTRDKKIEGARAVLEGEHGWFIDACIGAHGGIQFEPMHHRLIEVGIQVYMVYR